MKILLIGSGGREHALGHRLLQDHEVSGVIVYPGNPGMKYSNGLQPTLSSTFTFEEALSIAKKEEIDLVVIGPEAPLFEGWVDRFKLEKIAVFGPSKAASFLEQSKIKSKEFMKEAGIQTASFQSASTLDQALLIIKNNPSWDGYALKLSGPALGKGVIVTDDADTACEAAQNFFNFKPPGIEEGMVIEEKISGKEVSLFYVCMGEEFRFLASACDHKRLKDGDLGPNTGGMGAYSPANWISDDLIKTAEEDFLKPTLSLLKKKGMPFNGILFLGLMVKNGKPYLLEYNVRFGDPETQTFLPRLEGSLTSLLHAVALEDPKKFKSTLLKENEKHTIHVVKASKGYPGLFGEEIELGKTVHVDGPMQTENSQLYFAGVKEDAGALQTSGGRVLGITLIGSSISEVQLLSSQKIRTAFFEGEQYRTDIGVKR